MAKKIYSKEMILDETFKYCSNNSIESLSVRKLAKKIGSSVMPIYDSFDSKEGLIKAMVNYAIAKSLPTEGYDSYNERCYDLLAFGLNYPNFYLDLVKLNKKYQFTSDHLISYEKMMRNNSDLMALSFDDLKKINSTIEVYIMGLILLESTDLPVNEERKRASMIKLSDFIDRIIASYL